MGQGDSARDFGPSERMENAGILDVFPIFHTARLGQKIRRSPQLPPSGVALRNTVGVRDFLIRERTIGEGGGGKSFGKLRKTVDKFGTLC